MKSNSDIRLNVSLCKKLKGIRGLVLDCDGVLTDGRIFFNQGSWVRFFSIKDGLGIKRLLEAGFQLGVVTQSCSEDIAKRVEHLKIPFFYQGILDKRTAFLDCANAMGLEASEIAYMGDDLPDIPPMSLCGFRVTVPQAEAELLKNADWVTTCSGGQGAVREFCEILLKEGPFLFPSSF